MRVFYGRHFHPFQLRQEVPEPCAIVRLRVELVDREGLSTICPTVMRGLRDEAGS